MNTTNESHKKTQRKPTKGTQNVNFQLNAARAICLGKQTNLTWNSRSESIHMYRLITLEPTLFTGCASVPTLRGIRTGKMTLTLTLCTSCSSKATLRRIRTDESPKVLYLSFQILHYTEMTLDLLTPPYVDPFRIDPAENQHPKYTHFQNQHHAYVENVPHQTEWGDAIKTNTLRKVILFKLTPPM